MTLISRHIHINGIVQGVGFRPFIYNLALDHNLTGWVRNSANGVDIEISGDEANQQAFISQIPLSAPPLAQIDDIDVVEKNPQSYEDFQIIHSKDRASDFIPVSPDIAICSQCQEELFNPEDRRFRYPFINCTNCGPRYSIIKDIPYDRPKTTMASFSMCAACRQEYDIPRDRRFHAQPVACPDCGPQVWLELTPNQRGPEGEDAIQSARTMLAEGKILAIKGLGGFHLACDAKNQKAVDRLRRRKKRPAKPFALMAFDLRTIKKYVLVSKAGENLLTSPQAPIVLLPKRNVPGLAETIAPGQTNLGLMLPYTPLHLLLMEPGQGFPDVLVMTSGNLSEEPILHKNDSAREKLGNIADAFLLHDRLIYRRIDDSVFAIIEEKPYPIRRARGYAPNPIRLDQPMPQILATGPQMKNTFCLTREKYAFVSHYIGEMENWETYRDYQEAIDNFENLFRLSPKAISYDRHPDYTATKYALQRATQENLPTYPVQHHHAHLAAGMIENHLPPQQKVGGLIFDGTGYGSDGTIWGGEILVGNCLEFDRFAFLKPVPLPGGDITIQQPARMALSTLWAYGLAWDEHLLPVQALSPMELKALRSQLENGVNVVQTSSMGRLFDTISSIIGVRHTISYEAQAAIELEAIADHHEIGYYPWRMEGSQINIQPMLESILQDLSQGRSQTNIAAKFHNTLARLSLEMANEIKQCYGIYQIVLSGGVWQNQYLLYKTIELLRNHQFESVIHQQLPPNDGCVAFGQAMIGAYRYLQDKE